MAITSGLFAQKDFKSTLCSKDGWALIIEHKEVLLSKMEMNTTEFIFTHLSTLLGKKTPIDVKTFLFKEDGTFDWNANASCGNTIPHGGGGKWKLGEGLKKKITLTFNEAPEGWKEKIVSYTIKSVSAEKIDFERQRKMY